MIECILSLSSGPHKLFFMGLQYIRYFPIAGLLLCLVIVICATVVAGIVTLLRWAIHKLRTSCGNSGTHVSHRPFNWHSGCSLHCLWKQFNSRILFWIFSLGRFLSLGMFSSLFTTGKQRTQASDNLSTLLLNRKIEDNYKSTVMEIFSFMSLAVALASVQGFFSCIPLVTTRSDCHEKDDSSHPLFCYTNISYYPITCTNLANQTGAKDEFTCYALSLDIIGIAFAAALTIYSTAVAIIVVCFRIVEYMLKNCKNGIDRDNCRCNNTFTCERLCKYIGTLILGIIATISAFATICDLIVSFKNACSISNTQCATQIFISVNSLMSYWTLPASLSVGLIVISWKLKKHCEEKEYYALLSDQQPQMDQPQDSLPPAVSRHDHRPRSV